DVQTGKIAFKEGGYGTSGSTWESSPGSSVKFIGGTFNLKGGSLADSVIVNEEICTVNAEGVTATEAEIEINTNPTLNIPSGSFTVKKLTVGGGAKVKGSGTLKISGSLNWKNDAYMRGAGSTVILPGAMATTAEMTGSYERIEGRRIVNEGTFTAAAGE